MWLHSETERVDDVGFVCDVQSRRSYIDTAEDVVAHPQNRLPSSRESDTLCWETPEQIIEPQVCPVKLLQA